MTRLVLLALLASTLWIIPGVSVAAPCGEAQGAADLDSGVLGAQVTIHDECAARNQRPGGQVSYPFTYETLVDAPVGLLEACPEGEVLARFEVTVILYQDHVGTRGTVIDRCVPYGEVGAPALPPTDALVTDAVRALLPVPEVALNPATKGLVQLETWFWAQDIGAVDHDGDASTPPRPGRTVTASVTTPSGDVVAVTATAWISQYAWQVDDGLVLTSARPGSEDDPAVTHTYTTTGPRRLQASTTWMGTWTSTLGAGGSLGPVTLDGPITDYHVHEVRSVPADEH